MGGFIDRTPLKFLNILFTRASGSLNLSQDNFEVIRFRPLQRRECYQIKIKGAEINQLLLYFLAST